MIWEIFSKRERPLKGGKKDDTDRIIEVIEGFAPKKHRSYRETHYYNYRILEPYRRPLLALLETLSQRGRLEKDRRGLADDLFSGLKRFYDPKDKMDMSEALEDRGLLEKFLDLFLVFYDVKGLSIREVKAWLRQVQVKGRQE